MIEFIQDGAVISLILGVIALYFQWRREKHTPEISLYTAESAIEFQRVQASDTVAARALAFSESISEQLKEEKKEREEQIKEIEEWKKEVTLLRAQLNVLITWAEELQKKWAVVRLDVQPPRIPTYIIDDDPLDDYNL